MVGNALHPAPTARCQEQSGSNYVKARGLHDSAGDISTAKSDELGQKEGGVCQIRSM